MDEKCKFIHHFFSTACINCVGIIPSLCYSCYLCFTQSMIEINQLPKAGLMALDQAQNNAPVITRSGFQFLLMERSSQVINECSDGSHQWRKTAYKPINSMVRSLVQIQGWQQSLFDMNLLNIPNPLYIALRSL